MSFLHMHLKLIVTPTYYFYYKQTHVLPFTLLPSYFLILHIFSFLFLLNDCVFNISALMMRSLMKGSGCFDEFPHLERAPGLSSSSSLEQSEENMQPPSTPLVHSSSNILALLRWTRLQDVLTVSKSLKWLAQWKWNFRQPTNINKTFLLV